MDYSFIKVRQEGGIGFLAFVRPEVLNAFHNEMMAVGGHVQPARPRRQAARKQMLEAQSAVLSDHNSGKTRLSRVERR